MNEDPKETLKTSDDPVDLFEASLALAERDSASDCEVLCKALQSTSFLDRLDPPDAEAKPQRSRVARVLETIGKNRADAARETLIKLTRTPGFLLDGNRTNALILACGSIRPPPPEVMTFWDRHCQPGDGYRHLTIQALLSNGTETALGLFEKKMSDPEHEDDAKLFWMHNLVLVYRHQAGVLESCGRLLAEGLPEGMRPILVESLFDYDSNWYPPANLPRPPKLAEYGPSGRAKAREVGEYALKAISLTARQRKAVEETLEQLKKGRVGDTAPAP